MKARGETFALVFCLTYSSNLKLEATCSSESSVDFQRTARHYIPEDRPLHNHCCESLKSYIFQINLLKLRITPKETKKYDVSFSRYFFFSGATAPIWPLAYLHETLRFTSVF
jgi:hypothetical protein